jgi:hypothetical protein
MHKFHVLYILLEWSNRNPVIQLLTKRVDGIIDENDVRERHISEDAQIFDVDVVSRLDALVSVEAVLDQPAVGVEIIQNGVCIAWVRGGEHADLVVLV